MSKGFSLVELSIVLVILGLLVGGIMTGQNLIRAAELRSVVTQVDAVRASVYQFKDRYFAYPGDMKNATDFWGNADTGGIGGDCTNSHLDVGTDNQTCNGNGNGFVARTGDSANNRNAETFRFWEHLSNAGLVEGNYTGVGNDVGGGTFWYRAVPGENVLRMKLDNGGMNAVAFARSANGSPPNAWVGSDSDVVRNYAFVGAPTLGDLNWKEIFTPEELWNLDTKLDDGKPGTGIVSSHAPETCATSNDETTSEYALSNTAVVCTAFISMSF